MKKITECFLVALIAITLISPLTASAEKKDFKVAWSHYTGWGTMGVCRARRNHQKVG